MKQPSNFLPDRNANGTALSPISGKSLPGPSITGVVTDATGAIIPGASLKITDTRTGLVRTTTSDRNGHYVVGGLQPDAYQVEASAPAFEIQRKEITLTAAQQSVVNLSLTVGATSETVELSAALR